MAGTVAPLKAVLITYRVVIRQLVSTGRLIALGLIGVAVVLVGWSIGNAERTDFPPPTAESLAQLRLEDAVYAISLIGFTILVPIVALVFAAASLGDTREDGTLVYLWLRPMGRWTIAVGAWLAALSVSLPLTLVPLTVMSLMLDTGSDLVIATMIATTVGVMAYTALFVFLGTLVKNAIVWGMAYVIIWEGIIAAFGTAAAKVAIRGYASSILTARTDVQLEIGNSTQAMSILVTALVALAAIAFASLRLEMLEVD